MADAEKMKSEQKVDRKLGDEWSDWDGTVEISAETDGRVFIGVAVGAIFFILGITALFGWSIYPRLNQMGHYLGPIFNYFYMILAGILISWLLLFLWGALTKRPFISGLILIPKLVNWLLAITIYIGKLFGVSRDRLVNSFLKLHNLFLSTDPHRVKPERLLIMLPRCLSKEMNQKMRQIRDRHGIKLTTAGGGGEARRKIREIRPGLIIAVACERDLLLGFIDVNPHIPVIGFPNIRPCGPCKDTEVDLSQIETAVLSHLRSSEA